MRLTGRVLLLLVVRLRSAARAAASLRFSLSGLSPSFAEIRYVIQCVRITILLLLLLVVLGEIGTGCQTATAEIVVTRGTQTVMLCRSGGSGVRGREVAEAVWL